MEGGGGLDKAPRQRMSPSDDKPYSVDEAEVTNRLYVGNLDYGTSWQDLKDHFKPCGTVVFADVFREERGRSKGCGIVEFETRAEALQALRTLNHTTIGDSTFKIFIREDREDKARGGGRGGRAGAGRGGGGGGGQGGGGSRQVNDWTLLVCLSRRNFVGWWPCHHDQSLSGADGRWRQRRKPSDFCRQPAFHHHLAGSQGCVFCSSQTISSHAVVLQTPSRRIMMSSAPRL